MDKLAELGNQIKALAAPLLLGVCVYFLVQLLTSIEDMQTNITLILTKFEVKELVDQEQDNRITDFETRLRALEAEKRKP